MYLFIHLPFLSSNQKSIDTSTKKYIEIINDAFSKGFLSIKAENFVKKSVSLQNTNLIINNHIIPLNGKNIFIIGGGKATFEIVETLIPILGDYYTSGIINIPKTQFKKDVFLPKTTIIKAGHPYPDEGTFLGTTKQLGLLASLTENDIVLVIITGGASSLLELPESSLSSEDIIEMYKQLVVSGLPIHDINIVRKHLSQIKGGKLLFKTTAQLISLLISDVPGNDLSTIGSGPTVADSSSFQECLDIVQKSTIAESIPHTIKDFIASQAQNEQKGLSGNQFASMKPLNILLSSNETILKTLQENIHAFGIPVEICSTAFAGEAGEIGKFLVDYSNFPYTGVPMCLLFGGESVVTISNKKFNSNNQGGRNQELVLQYIYYYLKNEVIHNILVLSIGTDGIDGNSTNSGAYFSNNVQLKDELNIHTIKKHLDNHTSANALPSHYYIKIGPTGTNVGDIILLLKY